jgi:hypothetical protein
MAETGLRAWVGWLKKGAGNGASVEIAGGEARADPTKERDGVFR